MRREHDRPLWTCPKCGARLVTRDMSHSCGAHSVEAFLEGKGPAEVALFRTFEAMVAKCGPYLVAPAKTRIAFMARTRFASVNSLGPTGMRFHIGLPRIAKTKRAVRIEELGPWKIHHFKVSASEELDAEIQDLLHESYHQMGLQGRLKRRPPQA